MRKLLLALLFMSLTSLGYCGPINTSGYPAIITGDDVSINWLNNFRFSVVNTLNSFPGENIQVTTITADSMVNNANPEIRWGEAFNEFVYTGLLPATGTRAAAVITAGTAYIKNDTTNRMTRIVKDATTPGSTNYPTTKDIYVDLSTVGAYTYQPVTCGNPAPSIATNSIRLAKVVTNATDVTSVTDLRVMGVQLSTSEDFYLKGMKLYPSTLTAISADAGVVYNGTTRIAKTSATILTLSTAADWWDGGVDTYAGGAGWVYIGVNSTGSIKFIGANAPNRHDTSGNTIGTLYYWYDGSAYWRVIGNGWVTITNQFSGVNLISGDIDQFWTQYACVTFKDATVYNSKNVTSITDTDVGDWMVNLSITFADANYYALGTANDASGGAIAQIYATTTTTTRLTCNSHDGSARDPSQYMSMFVFR